jgi:hypothetical protein
MRHECPEPRKSSAEQEVIIAKLKRLQPRADRQVNTAFIDDAELACMARSVDLSTPEHVQQWIDELGMDATAAVQDFLQYQERIGDPHDSQA